MLGFLIRRLAILPLTALLAVALAFALLHLAAGDPIILLLGERATAEQIAAAKAALGYDRPLPIQFFAWSTALLRLDLGASLATQLPVVELLAQRLPTSLALAGLAFVFSLLLAVPLLLLTPRRGLALPLTALSALCFSIPVFLWGYFFVAVFALGLGWLPAQGWSYDGGASLPYLILPALSLAPIQAALILRLTRPSLAPTGTGATTTAFIEAASARGESGLAITLRYRLRAAVPALLTASGLSLTTLLGGVVVTESVFALPGLGRLAASAALARDYPVVQGVVLLFAALVILLNLVLDALHAALDPRVRL